MNVLQTPQKGESDSALRRAERRSHNRPAEGYVRNPLKSWPRNGVCFCGKNVKFKKCCMKKMAAYMPKKDADKILKQLPGPPKRMYFPCASEV